MNPMRDRARSLFPSVLLTLLSMVQAIALELIWSKVREADYLWLGGWAAGIGWAQVVVMGLGILQIWLFQVNLVLRFEWVPSTQDSILPFVIGAIEFTLIDLIGPARVAEWLFLFGVVFGVSLWTSHSVFVRARLDASNDAFFSRVMRATWRDFLPGMIAIATIWLFALFIHVLGDQSLLAFVSVLVTGALIGYQIDITRRFWDRSMHEEGPAPGA